MRRFSATRREKTLILIAVALGLVSIFVNVHPLRRLIRHAHQFKIKAISVGAGHICAVTLDDRLRCWGRNLHGQIGNGSTEHEPDAVGVALPPVRTVITLDRATCAITLENEVYCWGDNSDGHLALASHRDYLMPELIRGLPKVLQVTFGLSSACALAQDQTVYCWGRNRFAQLGNGLGPDSDVPVQVQGLTKVRGVGNGGRSFCASTEDGENYCWGDNGVGQMGLGDVAIKLRPTRLTLWPKLRSYSNGWGHACGVTLDDGHLLCAGLNGHGELGDGTRETRLVPTLVKDVDEEIVGVFVGPAYTCAQAVSGTVYCWGDNHGGLLGTGSHEALIRPSRVDIPPSRSLYIDGHTFCSVARDDKLYCWGANNFGQLGQGHTQPVTVPKIVDLPGGVKSVDMHSGHLCAVLADGDLYCWGYSNGNWGEGLPKDILKPQHIAIY